MSITPIGYLTLRREAAGLSMHDVAARLVTDPPMSERDRVLWVRAIEGGIMPASFETIVALRAVYRFDLAVLAALEARRLGLADTVPDICRTCGCSEWDACESAPGVGCGWVDSDLCSACSGPALPGVQAVAA